RRQFMQTFRVVANQCVAATLVKLAQNSTSRSHICDSKKFMWRPNTGTVFSPRQTPPRSQMGSHDLPSRYLAGVVSKTFLLSVPLFRIEASPRPCLSLTFQFTCNTRSR